MADAVLPNRVPQDPYGVVLAAQLAEPARSVAAVKRLMGHGARLPRGCARERGVRRGGPGRPAAASGGRAATTDPPLMQLIRLLMHRLIRPDLAVAAFMSAI